MLIQLKQREIETAIRQYVSSQGINLSNKVVTITFTASRSEGGTIADVDLEEIEQPAVAHAPENSVMHSIAGPTPDALAAGTEEPDTLGDSNEPAIESAIPVKKVSLFT